MSRERLSTKLPILAQLSLDGNCFLLMDIAMICFFMVGANYNGVSVLAIAALVLFLDEETFNLAIHEIGLIDV